MNNCTKCNIVRHSYIRIGSLFWGYGLLRCFPPPITVASPTYPTLGYLYGYTDNNNNNNKDEDHQNCAYQKSSMFSERLRVYSGVEIVSNTVYIGITE